MAWSDPHTYLVGELPSAGLLNRDIRDNQDYLFGRFVGAVVYRSSTQATSSSITYFSWQTELLDTDGIWDNGNPTRFVVPEGAAGTVRAFGNAGFAIGSSFTYIRTVLRKNGTDVIADERSLHRNVTSSYAEPIVRAFDIMAPIDEGDYVEVGIATSAGGTFQADRRYFCAVVFEP